jgi:rsbT co-antagonist protein RsbR
MIDPRSPAFLQRIIDGLPDSVFVKDAKDLRYLVWNRECAEVTGVPAEDVLGKFDRDIFPAERAAEIEATDREILAGGRPIEIREDVVPTRNQGVRIFRTRKVPILGDDGEPYLLLGFAMDDTERQHAEDALRKTEAELRATQERLLDTIRELSIPILPIHDGILVAPLIGQMDDARGAELLETLLKRIHALATHSVILDVTGLRAVDARVAGYLLQAVRAAELLGARAVIVGISPAMAATLVELGEGLSAVVTRSDLQAGVAYALALRRGGPSTT